MRRFFVMITVLFQFVVLGYMAGEREYLIRMSQTIYLRTAPVDPRDIFRGDFVRLEYDISRIPNKLLKGNLLSLKDRKGLEVYTVLEKDHSGVASMLYCTDVKPVSGLFIRGRITDNWRLRMSGNGIAVKYGIESYFVEQGKGLEIEKRRGGRNDLQMLLEMETALGSNGKAVLKGHRWCPISIGLTLTAPDTSQLKYSASVRLTLANTSDMPLALVLLPDHRSFSLEPAQWSNPEWRMDVELEPVTPSDTDVRILQPTERFHIELDLSEPRWFVKTSGPASETGLLPASEMFRIVYRSPPLDACRHLQYNHLIWSGSIPSRAFHGGGMID